MGNATICSFGCSSVDGCRGDCSPLRLENAYDEYLAVEGAYAADPTPDKARAADDALEALSAIAYQNGYEPSGSLGLTEWVVREIAG